MAELVDRSFRGFMNPGEDAGPVILERRLIDGGWAPVWEYERTEEASRAVQTRVGAHDGMAADYRVRPLERRSWIKRAVLGGCIGLVVFGCIAMLVVALVR